ncbi:MAG: YaaA family protein [Bacteroides sp.]|nr:YaaA family protein [Bacteroides sp.]MBD5337475.1 YaaA family protein [Bacteroides sp.]
MILTLIAESKTMTPCDCPVTPEQFATHRPAGEPTADEIMARIATMDVSDLMEATRFSRQMAAKALYFAYDFPDKSHGQEAIAAFTGVVFKSFDYATLDENERRLTADTIRLISSLYGWLRPDDLIKPYRLDYTTPLAPDDWSMVQYWKKDVTIAMVREIQASPGIQILNLLPADAAKAIDWKLIKHFAPVWKIDFKELRDGATWRTPTSNHLKELRGHLLREIIRRSITDPSQLLTLETDRLQPLGTPDYPDHIAFCV